MDQSLPFAHVGATYGSYRALKITSIGELRTQLVEVVHEPTGAELMFLVTDDPENLFCLSFSTRPFDSKGTAHILEHVVLCGSEKYPVRDPFFAMTRRSLNTFMNAFTGADFTCYPAATLVEADFYNLLDVYIDAVFFPTIARLSFLQEGHRLSFQKAEDPTSALMNEGIVFNEMKGALANAESRIWHKMNTELMPDTLYAFNSGGEPEEIPKLTYEELVCFHKTFYHPSRCLFFFYGNLPVKQHLDFLEQTLLSKTSRKPPLPALPLQPRFSAPKEVRLSFPASPEEQKAIVSFGYLTGTNQDQEEVLALALLDSILMDTDASPLKKKLLASNLCIQASSALETQLNDVPYIFTFRGCQEEKMEELKAFFYKALREVVAEGISDELVASSLHQLEFSRSEIGGDNYPFGLTLFFRAALAKQHGCLPENSLVIHSLFKRLLEQTKDPLFLPSLIERYLLNNTHAVFLLATPNAKITAEEEAAELALLEKIKASLSEEEKEKIVEENLALLAFQETEDDPSCLPQIALADVPQKPQDYLLRQKKEGDLTLFHHECFTNKIIYADLLFSLPAIAPEELAATQFLTYILTDVGVGKKNFEEVLNEHHAHIGSIGASIYLHAQTAHPGVYKPALHLKGKALESKAPELFRLFEELVSSVRLDETDRIAQLLQQKFSAFEHRLSNKALHYAKALALAGFSEGQHLYNEWNGLPYFFFLRDLSRNPAGLGSLTDTMRSLVKRLFALPEQGLVLSSGPEAYHDLHEKKFYNIGLLPSTPTPQWEPDYLLPKKESQFRIIASPVSFTVAACHAPTYLDPDSPALSIAAELFSNLTLHPEIREKGGAYGSGASYQSGPGIFTFHSYRDPHIARSAEIFLKAIDRIASGKFNRREVEEAKLGIIQNLDTPISPCSRASAAHSLYRGGKTYEMRELHRKRLLACTEKEVADAVKKHLSPQKEELILVSFAGKELLEREAKKLPSFWKQAPILAI